MAVRFNSRTLDYAARITLCGGIWGGFVGVIIDLDHILCALQMGLPLLPVKGWYGCKIWHRYIGPAGWVVCGITVTCLLGWAVYMAYHAARSTHDHNLLETRQAGEEPEVRYAAQKGQVKENDEGELP